MTHPRRVIRDAIADAILNGGTNAEGRVWASREPPVKVESVLIEQGPVVLVYTCRDFVQPEDYPVAGAGRTRRTVEIAIEITAAGNDVVEDKLDDLAEQVEAIIDVVQIPDQAATEIRYVSTDTDISTEFEMPLGGALIKVEAKYWKNWRVQDEPEWSACGGSVYSVPFMNGAQVGPVELVSSAEDCPC
jgi:hypothetical protein